jgi:hypothetical protein
MYGPTCCGDYDLFRITDNLYWNCSIGGCDNHAQLTDDFVGGWIYAQGVWKRYSQQYLGGCSGIYCGTGNHSITGYTSHPYQNGPVCFYICRQYKYQDNWIIWRGDRWSGYFATATLWTELYMNDDGTEYWAAGCEGHCGF